MSTERRIEEIDKKVDKISDTLARISTTLELQPQIYATREEITTRIEVLSKDVRKAIADHAAGCSAKSLSPKQIVALCAGVGTGIGAIITAASAFFV